MRAPSDQSRNASLRSWGYPFRVLTVDQIHLLRRSFDRVEARPVVAALIFYRRLFHRDPSLRALFKTDIEAQAAKLIEMLGCSLSLLEQPTQLADMLERLGARHAGYGVREEHYATVGTALLDMLDEVLGNAFTSPVREAWSSHYGNVADSMMRGARMAGEAGLHPGPAHPC